MNAVSPARERPAFSQLFTAVLLPMFLAAVDQTVLALATPAIGRQFGSMEGISWLAVGYLLASVSLIPLYGRMADRHGRRRMLGVAIGVFATGSLACLFANNLPTLVAARAVQGAGGAGLMSLSQALIGEVLQPRERGRYQIYFSTIFASASLFGPVLGGVVVELGDWRWLFAMNLPLCALAAWRLSQLRYQPPALNRDGRIDIPGGLLFALAAGLSLFLVAQGVRGPSGGLAWTLGGVALLAWIALFRWSRKTPQPYLPLELLRIPVMRHAAIATVTYAAAMYSLVFYLPAYVQTVFGSSSTQSGLLLIPLTAGMLIGSTLAGRFVMRTGKTREPPLFGLLLSAICLGLLGLLAPSRQLVLLLGGLCGLGLGTVMTVTQIITQVTAGPQKLGAAAAVISLSRNLGAASGAAAFGAIAFGFSALLGSAASSTSARMSMGDGAGFHAAFLASSLCCLVGVWAASRLPREQLAPEPRHD